MGNEHYRVVSSLPNAGHDARAMAARLRALGFDVTLALDADKASFEQSVNAFTNRLEKATAAVFYYAGHGLQVDGRNFMVPVDARANDEADLPFEFVALDIVLNRFANHRITSIVILDACRDNPLGAKLSKALGERQTAVGRGLAAVSTNVGTLVSYSTQPGNVALDGEGRHSPFTDALLNHIATPELDVQDMMRRVRRDVVAATRREQIPWDHSSLVEPFFFLPTTASNDRPLPFKNEGERAQRQSTPDPSNDIERDLALVLPPDSSPATPAQSGLPPVTDCDRFAASASDPERVVPGNRIGELDGPAGIRACRAALARYPNTPRFEFQLARSLHKAKQYEEAARFYRPLVRRGYLAALTNYGWLLDNGAGVPKDHAAAVRLHLLAAHQGDQFGMFNAAMAYDAGNGLPYNPRQAAHWMYAALRLGHYYSINRMTTDALGWTKAFRVELQRLLRDAGLYQGPLDGVFGPDVHRAVRELQHHTMAPTPGGTVPARRFDPRSIPINAPRIR